jgi:2-hydroxychromene-2-carboxylate isomerase
MSDKLDWYFAFISPYAYLQWRRLWRDSSSLASRLSPKPVLLAGLLNHWGQLGPAELPGKRRHTYRQVLFQARALGVDDPATAIAAPAVKQELAANGADAIALQVFGVPTIVIDGELFWGNDATPMAQAYLADRSLFEDPEMRRIDSLPAAAERPRAKA